MSQLGIREPQALQGGMKSQTWLFSGMPVRPAGLKAEGRRASSRMEVERLAGELMRVLYEPP